MKTLGRLSAFAFLLSQVAVAQKAPSPVAGPDDAPRRLQITNSTVLPSAPAGAMMLPVRCDPAGNFYVRLLQPTDQARAPILKLGPSGSELARYSPTTDLDLTASKATAGRFFVFDDGVVQLARDLPPENTGYNQYIVVYRKDGGVKSKVKTSAKDIDDVVMFPRGGFIVSGIAAPVEHGQITNEPFTAVLNESGEVLKRVHFEDDGRFTQQAQAEVAQYASTAGHGNFAVSRGHLLLGGDGNAYVVRWANPAIVYVVSPGGEVVRRFEVKSDRDRTPEIAQVDNNYMAIVFGSKDNRDAGLEIAVVNLLDGETVARYASDEGVNLACFSAPNKFTFFIRKNGKLVAETAEPH